MASREQLIFDLLTGKDTLNPNLKKAEKKSKNVSGSIGKGLVGAFKKVGPAAALVTAAVSAIGGALVLDKSIDEARELENALIGLRSVATNLNQDVDFVTQAAKDLSSDGLIPLSQTSAALKNLLATGLDGQKAVEVFKALRDSAAFNRQGQLELGEAIVGASEGLKNDLSIKVDNAGITKNLSNIQKDYAREIGVSAAKLTEAQRAQAKYVGVIKEASVFQGDYNKLLVTFSGAQSQSTGEFKFLLAEIGQFITKSPQVIAIVRDTAKTFSRLKDFLIENRKSIQQFVNAGLERIVQIGGPAIAIIQGVTNALAFVGRIALVSASGITQLLQLLTDNEPFKAFADNAVKSFTFIGAGLSKLLEGFVGTGIGASIAETLGIDPEAVKKKTDEIARGLIEFGQDFEGGDVAESLGKASDAIKGAITFTDESLEAVNEGFEKAKSINQEFVDAVVNSDNERTRVEIANANKRKDANDKENKDKQKGNQAFYDFTIKQEELTQRQRVQALKGALGQISTLQSQSNKELFFIGKAAAISQATIDGILAVQKALTAAPPPFNFALAALVGVATAANVAKIGSAKPPAAQTGGILDPNGSNTTGDFLPFSGNSGEAILTKGQQARFIELADGAAPAGGASPELLDEIRGLREDMANQEKTFEVDGRVFARIIRDQVKGGFAI